MNRLPVLAVFVLAGCSTVPGDDRSNSERLVDGAFNVLSEPAGIAVETVAGPAIDEIVGAANRIDAWRQSRQERRDARALCLANSERHEEQCRTAFPKFFPTPETPPDEASEPIVRSAPQPNPQDPPVETPPTDDGLPPINTIRSEDLPQKGDPPTPDDEPPMTGVRGMSEEDFSSLMLARGCGPGPEAGDWICGP